MAVPARAPLPGPEASVTVTSAPSVGLPAASSTSTSSAGAKRGGGAAVCRLGDVGELAGGPAATSKAALVAPVSPAEVAESL